MSTDVASRENVRRYIIDGHSHVFPDKIAEKAATNIGAFYGLPMRYNGTISNLLELGNQYGISKHLIHSVATIPDQVESINNFIARSVDDFPNRLIGFASLHPDMADPATEVARVIGLGLKGIKLHPDFQRFYIDEKKMDRIYSVIEGKLPLLIHTGDQRYDYSSPSRVVPVLERFPRLDVICAHFGGWSEWDEASQVLAGKRIWVDTCSTFGFVTPDRVKKMIMDFGEDRVIFGSDYPMWNPGDELTMFDKLDLSEQVKNKIFYRNICDLLQIDYS